MTRLRFDQRTAVVNDVDFDTTGAAIMQYVKLGRAGLKSAACAWER